MKYIFIIIIIFFIIKYYNTYENFTTTSSAQDLIYSIYQNDVNIINKLSNLAEELQSSGIILLNNTNINKDLNILATYSPNILSFNNKWKLYHTSNPLLSSIPEMHDLVFIYNDNSTDNEVMRLNNTRQVIINNELYCSLLQSDNILTFKGNINLVSSNDSNKIDINDTDIKITGEIKSATDSLMLSSNNNFLELTDSTINVKGIIEPTKITSGNNSIEINNTNIIFNGKTEFKKNVTFTNAICKANNSENNYIINSAARKTTTSDYNTNTNSSYNSNLSSASYWINLGCGTYRNALQIYELVEEFNDDMWALFNFTKASRDANPYEKHQKNSPEWHDYNARVAEKKKLIKIRNVFGILTTHVFTNSIQSEYYIYQTYRIDNIIFIRNTNCTVNTESCKSFINNWTIVDMNPGYMEDTEYKYS